MDFELNQKALSASWLTIGCVCYILGTVKDMKLKLSGNDKKDVELR